MSDSCRQRYNLATGKGLTPAPGGPKTRFASGGMVRGASHKSCPSGFKKMPGRGK